MPSPRSILATAALIGLAHAKTIRVTATEDNKFDPDDIKADKGDVVEFVFEPKNHSVTASEDNFPCQARQIGKGFWSGFIDSDKGEADKVFRVKINNTEPMFFYSSQGKECPDGMVGIINGNSTRNLKDYKDQASKVSSGTDGAPQGAGPYGGELVDNKGGSGDDDDSDSSKKGGDDDDDEDAAGVIRVPTFGLLAAVGLVFFLA